MRNKREHPRIEKITIQGKITLAYKVEIIDISLGGIALKLDKRLEVGREYLIKLGDTGHCIDVRGTVVRSTLIGMEAGAEGESVLIYEVGVKFKDCSEDKITAFINSVEQHPKEEGSPIAELRLNVGFRISTPQNKVLVFPADFSVEDMTHSSMIIHSDQPLQKGNMVSIELYLNDENHLNFTGKVFSCQKMEDKDPAFCKIEMTYTDLAEKDQATLKKFIDYLVHQQ